MAGSRAWRDSPAELCKCDVFALYFYFELVDRIKYDKDVRLKIRQHKARKSGSR